MKYKVTYQGKVYHLEVEADGAVSVAAPAARPAAPSAPVVPTAAPAAPAAAPVVSAAATQPVIEAGTNTVRAPLPGTVLSISAAVGDSVKPGDVLMTLEAMKMENEIMADRAGTVAEILVTVGANVETGSALIVLS